MSDNFEKIISYVYKNWKKGFSKKLEAVCPNEEMLTCFKEGILSKTEAERIRLHLLICDKCSENVILDASVQAQDKEVPQEFVGIAEDLVNQNKDADVLEVILALKDEFLEVLSTSADFFRTKDMGLEPLILRAPIEKQKSEEVQLVKYFGQIKVNLKIEKQENNKVKIGISLLEKKTEKPKENLRASLKKDGQDLESYIVKRGTAVFAHVPFGRYEIEISDAKKKIGRVLLELR